MDLVFRQLISVFSFLIAITVLLCFARGYEVASIKATMKAQEEVVTEQRAVRSELVEVKQEFGRLNKLQKALETAGWGVVFADAENNQITSWNRNAELIFGYSKQDAMDLTVEDLMEARHRKHHVEKFRAGEGRSHIIDCEGVRDDGFPVSLELIMIHSAGDPTDAVAIFRERKD